MNENVKFEQRLREGKGGKRSEVIPERECDQYKGLEGGCVPGEVQEASVAWVKRGGGI